MESASEIQILPPPTRTDMHGEVEFSACCAWWQHSATWRQRQDASLLTLPSDQRVVIFHRNVPNGLKFINYTIDVKPAVQLVSSAAAHSCALKYERLGIVVSTELNSDALEAFALELKEAALDPNLCKEILQQLGRSETKAVLERLSKQPPPPPLPQQLERVEQLKQREIQLLQELEAAEDAAVRQAWVVMKNRKRDLKAKLRKVKQQMVEADVWLKEKESYGKRKRKVRTRTLLKWLTSLSDLCAECMQSELEMLALPSGNIVDSKRKKGTVLHMLLALPRGCMLSQSALCVVSCPYAQTSRSMLGALVEKVGLSCVVSVNSL